MLDIAPYYLTAIASLLGPYRAALGLASTPTPERRFGVGPRAGESFTVDVPTHAVAALQLESGALATLTVELRGVRPVHQRARRARLRRRRSSCPTQTPSAARSASETATASGSRSSTSRSGPTETRGLGLDEMLAAIREDRPHRASGALGLHVLETALAALRSAEEGRTVEIGALEAGSAAVSVGLRLAIGVAVLAAAGVGIASGAARRQTGSSVTRLVTDARDAKLVNAWGLAASPTGPWWVANEARDASTLYAATATSRR